MREDAQEGLGGYFSPFLHIPLRTILVGKTHIEGFLDKKIGPEYCSHILMFLQGGKVSYDNTLLFLLVKIPYKEKFPTGGCP